MNESRECNAEIVADVEGGLVEPHQEEKIESGHAESSVLHNLDPGTGGKPGGGEIRVNQGLEDLRTDRDIWRMKRVTSEARIEREHRTMVRMLRMAIW